MRIIVTTLQKFPVIYDEVDKANGRNYPIICDEAHSSQTGASALKLKAVLADMRDALREYADIEGVEEDKVDPQDRLVKELLAHGKHKNCIVSSVYDVIYVKDKSVLLPEYLMMWLSRTEFGRYVYWASQGTSYEFLSYDNLANYRIPVPSIDTQRAIVDVYNVLTQRKQINEQLKAQIKNICPILIKGSLEKGNK